MKPKVTLTEAERAHDRDLSPEHDDEPRRGYFPRRREDNEVDETLDRHRDRIREKEWAGMDIPDDPC